MTHPTAAATPVHAAMDQFAVANDELLLGGQPVSRLAARVGSTPFYAYDRQLLRQRCAALRACLPPGIELHYAVKANPFPPLLSYMVTLVDGMDVASGGELQLALNAGADPARLSFAGPAKRDSELLSAVAAGVLINLESVREVELLARASDHLGLPARVAVRVNPDFELKRSGMKMAGGSKPFGVDAEKVPQLLQLIRSAGLAFEGFHLFTGSQNLRADAIVTGLSQSYDLACKLACHSSEELRVLNLGGGFGIPYFPGESRLDTAPIAECLAAIADDARTKLPQASLVLELGRYLVGEAGIYVCRILDRKISRDHCYLITDGGLHHHLAASGNFGQVIRKNYPVAIANRIHAPTENLCTVVGPLCTPLDVLAERIALPQALPGDLVLVFQSGAYGASASPQAFLSHPPCTEILV